MVPDATDDWSQTSCYSNTPITDNRWRHCCKI